jgi:predicted RNase H-like HicB family nuclease
MSVGADGRGGDELASAVGRAWLAGYRAGRAAGGAEGEAAGTSTAEDLSVFTVTYTPTKDGRWKAQCTELPAAVMHAETLAKARDAILTKKQGYTANQAREIIAISRGESEGDVVGETEDAG